MTTDVEVAARPSGPLTDDDLHRMMEFERIVKLSESITAGKHPRIKLPAHLAHPSTRTTSPNLPARLERPQGRNTQKKDALKDTAKGSGSGSVGGNSNLGENLAAFGQNSGLSVEAAATESLPGLGSALGIRRVSPSKVAPEEIPQQRARVEALLREPPKQRSSAGQSDEKLVDFVVDDVLRRGRELEKTFTPPPIAISSQDDNTDLGGGASTKHKTKYASSAAPDSDDGETFYSSRFSTPEFALTSRVPAESENDENDEQDNYDNMSLQDGSDYEPELDEIAPPQNSAYETYAPAANPPHYGTMPAESQLAPAYQAGPQMDQAAYEAVFSQLLGLQNAVVAAAGQHASGSARVAAGNPQPASPFVRTHDLSPVAPQPAHISSLAAAGQLPLGAVGQQSGSQGTPAQIALLRRGEASQSSPDSSPYTGGRAADKGKGKKKAVGKRKADVNPPSPQIKSEPRSPSPILAPPAQRPNKRQKHDARPPPREVVYRRHAADDEDDEYSPTLQTASYGQKRVARDPRAPIIYERVDRGPYGQHRAPAATRRASLQRYEEQRNLEGGYEPAPPAHASTYSTRPPPDAYETGPERAGVRPVAMAPPPRTRIVVDEFGREYYEPAPPPPSGPRPQQPMVEAVTYDPNLTYERPASRLHQVRYEGGGGRYGSQAPPPVYDDEEIVYRRTSPVYAAPRRVVTQPEYVTREYTGYPRREFSVRAPSQYPPAVVDQDGYIVNEMAPAPGYHPRAATVRPPDSARYEAPPQGRFVERVGSVRPPDAGVPVYQGYGGGPEDGPHPPPPMYGAPRGPPEGGAYIEGGHHGPREVIREYSVRPEPHVVVHREYSARPGPAPVYYAEQPPYAMGGPPPPPEYGYPDERGGY